MKRTLMDSAEASTKSIAQLPPLRIHHFLVWTAVFSAVMTLVLSLWRVAKRVTPDSVVQEFSNWTVFFSTLHWIELSASLSVLFFGVFWRRKGLPFPSCPGHWLSLYVVGTGVDDLMRRLIFLTIQRSSGIATTAHLGMGLLYDFAMLWLSIAAYRQASGKTWRLVWFCYAIHCSITVVVSLLYTVILSYRYLYATLWVPGPVQLGWPFSWYVVTQPYMTYVPVALLAIFLVAVCIDLVNKRQAHWSHWSVVLTFLIYQIGFKMTVQFFW